MGVEKGFFGFLALVAAVLLGMRLYYFLPSLILLYLVGRLLSKRDAQFVRVLGKYINEEHVYDATPRPKDLQLRPPGWGKGLPR